MQRRIVYAYDTGGTGNRGQLTSVESNTYSGSVRAEFIYRQGLSYDTQGRLDTEEMRIGIPDDLFAYVSWTTGYDYDSYHRPLSVIYPDGSRVRTDYNSMGLPASLCDATSGNSCTSGAKLVDSVIYNESGQITSMNFPASGGYSRTYSYYGWVSTDGNSNGRLQQMKVLEDSSIERLKLTYAYDSFGSITKLTDGATAEDMSYDYRNRLLEAYGLNNAWDAAKVRPTTIEGKGFQYTRPMAPASAGTAAFSWDNNGNMLTREFDDANGVERSQTLAWDRENHLASVTGVGYNDNGVNRTEGYHYTTDGVRIRKVATLGSNTYTYYFPSRYYRTKNELRNRIYYFGNMLIGERSGDETFISRFGDQVDSARVTDRNGTVKNRRYTAYGDKRAGDSFGWVDSGFNYSGQFEDGTGLLYMNARYYDPNIGSFISPDSIIPDPTNPVDYNQYLYARGNPISNNDPTGHYTNDEIMQHFGVDSWEDVEYEFQKGGSHEGLWGWLHILQQANSGDIVTSQQWYGRDKAELIGLFRRSSTGTIDVEAVSYQGVDDFYAHVFPLHSVIYSESGFAQFAVANPDASGEYTLNNTPGRFNGDFTGAHTADCQQRDCLTGPLDAVGIGAAVFCVALEPCPAAAAAVGFTSGAIGVGWTGYNRLKGNSTVADIGVTVATTIAGKSGGPRVGLAASIFQWAWDTFVAPQE